MQQHKKYEWRTPFHKSALVSFGLGLAMIGGGTAALADADPPWFLPFDEMTEQEKRGMQIYYYDAGGVGSGIGCVDCHGDIGQGSMDMGAPAASGAIRSTFDTMMDGGAELMTFMDLKPKERDDVFSFLQVLRYVTRPEFGPLEEAGKKIYEELAGGVGCQACHGMDAAGVIGPDIRGKDPVAILDALKTVPDMGIIELTTEEVDQVAAYLRQLHEAEAH
jgi:mono/diheme cytochrome c family protein